MLSTAQDMFWTTPGLISCAGVNILCLKILMYVYFGPMVESSNRCLELVFELSNVSLFDQAPLPHMTQSTVSCQSMCCLNTL